MHKYHCLHLQIERLYRQVGSTITAGQDVTLIADDTINLQAAQNINTLKSENSGSSASLGIGFSLGGASNGFTINAGVSGSKGKANGNDSTWTETIAQGGNKAGDKVTFNSGGDTNIIGSQVIGNQIIANVGTSGTGNLNIQSLQDSSTYTDKQSDFGVSVSLCIPPFCYGASSGSVSAGKANTNSNYASVNEQAGFFTTNGGYQVNVNGNTNLTAAVMASSATAIQQNLNSLTTQTLSSSNIENTAEYKAEAMSASVSLGTQPGMPTLNGAGLGSDSGKANSVTTSGISGGTVNITDNNQQMALTGKDSVITVATLNRDVSINANGEAVDSHGNSTAHTIAPIFDREKVAQEIKAQVQITQAFSQVAPKALSSFAADKTKPYQDAQKIVREAQALYANETDPDKQAQLQNTINQAYETIAETQSDYDNWKANGSYRIASNIIIAAIGGGTSGAVGAVTKESLSWAADQMRQAMIEDSMKFPGICVGTTDCISNMSGESVGVNGDGKKVAGGRIVLAYWCDKGRCTPDTSTLSGYQENPDGTVIFNPGTDSQGKNLTIDNFISKYNEEYGLRSPLGGAQGGSGQMELFGIQFEYAAGSFWDKLAEAYSGTHDTLNSFIWYDELGNGKDLNGTLIGKIGNITNMTNVPVATPFAYSVLLPPEVWNAVFTLIKSK